MGNLNFLGMAGGHVLQRDGDRITHILTQRPLHRVLAFTGRTIDDVVNSPVAKNQVTGFYRLYRQVERQSEVTDLERQWNLP